MTWQDGDLDLALRSLRDDAPPDAAVAAVHARVMSGVRKPNSRWWHWAWAPVAAAAVLVVIVWPRPAQVAPPPLVAKAPSVAPHAWVRASATLTAPVAARTHATTRHRTQPPEPRIAATDAPGLVRIATGNPNIVILWSFNNVNADTNTGEMNR